MNELTYYIMKHKEADMRLVEAEHGLAPDEDITQLKKEKLHWKDKIEEHRNDN